MSKFFSKYDWAAFWVATLVTFGVYFYTLGPSVGLEDSGELATAAAHLGVPHPPGYPFWTLCSWIFCKIFAGVTYMGYPTPAWAVSCCSALFGALAAGCTAMLICRSAQDFIAPSIAAEGEGCKGLSPQASSLLCFAGGVGGALTFAFSPVEWSQSTIVEIYSLNALFLMLVFLLSYRWMRRPSDKTLWLTAFVFGLGLTNYQVLLFAIVPIAVIIALRNISLFRDFALYLIPVLLTYQVLQVGDLARSQYGMSRDVIEKHAPVGVSDQEFADRLMVDCYAPYFRACAETPEKWRAMMRNAQMKLSQARTSGDERTLREIMSAASVLDDVNNAYPRLEKSVKDDLQKGKIHEIVAHTSRCPSSVALVLSLVVLLGALLTAVWFRSKGLKDRALQATLYGGGAGALLLFLSGTVFVSSNSWAGSVLAAAPLVEPAVYVTVGACIAASIVAAVAAVIGTEDSARFARFTRKHLLIASSVAAGLAVLTVLAFVPAAKDVAIFSGRYGYTGEAFPWAKSTFTFALTVAVLFGLAATVKRGLAYAIPVAGFHLAVFLLLRNGAMNGLVHPASWWFWWPIAWNFVVLALAWHVLPHGRTVAGSVFFTQLGVAFYAYMPIVSDARNPPMNWAYPRTWEGFKHAITRGQYEQIKAENFAGLGDFFSFLKVQMGHYIRDVKLQFTDFLALVAVVPFACWRVNGRKVLGRYAVRSLWIVLALLAVFLLRDWCASATEAEDSAWKSFDRGLSYVLLSLAFVGGLAMGVRQFVVRPFLALARRFPKMRSLAAIVHDAFGRNMMKFEAKDVTQQWLISSGACFLMMSVILLLLAKVVGDVQDGFIQKVKFISSHAMIAMWIGYGLIVLAAFLARFIPERFRRPATIALALVLVCVAALPPLVNNYRDARLVFELGGAEQNEHTFGWQFGAYQLDGAKAIRDQIEADEEPLPDPDWPAPMEDHAVFFGGTDPGRFVPTYMIYSADFRPDVYLITQNALADDTYMSVERDLYGDEIWIPSKEDNGAAFQEFIDRLTPEEEKMYGVDKSNGRVQVTGATSVMKINELLVKKMFDKNKARHAFYVEESYPIDWMYDYLEPHGLIMKIAPEKTSSKLEDWQPLLRKDRDFWDWYTRRLLDDPMFRRDFAAQKSFAKLRTAIAGLVMNRVFSTEARREFEGVAGGFRECCEQAFREACLLGPISPESTFRYLQSQRLFRGRNRDFHFAKPCLDLFEDLIGFIDLEDPNNQRTRHYRPLIELWRNVYTLEEAHRKASPNERPVHAYPLALAYGQVAALDRAEGNRGSAAQASRSAGMMMAEAYPALSLAEHFEQAAEIFYLAQMDDRAEAAIRAYVAKMRRPTARMQQMLNEIKNQRSK